MDKNNISKSELIMQGLIKRACDISLISSFKIKLSISVLDANYMLVWWMATREMIEMG